MLIRDVVVGEDFGSQEYVQLACLLKLLCDFSGVAKETASEAASSVTQPLQESKTAAATAKAVKALPPVLSEASVMSVESDDDVNDLTGKTFITKLLVKLHAQHIRSNTPRYTYMPLGSVLDGSTWYLLEAVAMAPLMLLFFQCLRCCKKAACLLCPLTPPKIPNVFMPLSFRKVYSAEPSTVHA